MTIKDDRPAGNGAAQSWDVDTAEPTLRIPHLPDDTDTLSAALAYADAGWYLLPVRRALGPGGKHAGSVVGKNWPAKSSRDPQQLAAWFAGTDHSIVLHVGRSGAVAFDVDRPNMMPEELFWHTRNTPFQNTRPGDDPERGHYVFEVPPGMTFGNGGGRLGNKFGEVRGANGVILVAPHPDGRRWTKTGTVATLPDQLAAMLPARAGDAEAVVSDAAVEAFLNRHETGSRPTLLAAHRKYLTGQIEAGASRHNTAVRVAVWAMEEAAAGYLHAREAADTLGGIVRNAWGLSPNARTPARAAEEWAGILAWAVAQALAADHDAVRARVQQRMPDNIKVVERITAPETVTHTSHLGMAYKLGKQFRNKLLYVNGVGWHRWDGKRWAPDGNGAARRAVHTVLKREWVACAKLPAAERDERAKQISRYETASAISGILTEAAALEVFSVEVSNLDADPWKLNCANGTLDLHTMQLHEATPDDRITKLCRGAYHTDADAPAWNAFLTQTLPDEEVRQFVQRLAGLALLGEVREHILPIFIGTGANGKSTFCKALLHDLGDYGATAEADLFTHRENAHPTGQMDLLGRRFVVVSETDEGKRLAEATMKRLTGGDPITARWMRQNNVTFTPSHLPVLVTNHLPKVSGDDPAIWRRIRVVPWNVAIPDDEQDKTLDAALQLEADGIMSWCVDGLRAYLADGLAEPASVRKATTEYRTDSDSVARFIAEECHPAAKITAGELFDAWDRWRKLDGAQEISKTAFGKSLNRLGYRSSDSNGKRWWHGLCILESGEQ